MAFPNSSQLPGAVKRMGKDIFVKLPLFRSKKRYIPIYINKVLYEEFFGKVASHKEMTKKIADMFSVTIDPDEARRGQIGWAYTDRQYDPLNIALKDNLGSGRAYYIGKNFNLKGEKTPLATSSDPYFSNGFLEAERGIWEALISNTLDGDMETGVPPILAILDTKELCFVQWRKELVKRVRIIRIDRKGALDRLTHTFLNKAPLSKKVLLETARCFGRQEGEKFMGRILHGAWSAGNISLKGDLMDFDTVCAVKGRAPQFSANLWHHENFFGYEWEGQTKILKSLCDDAAINSKRMDYESLHQVMVTAMDYHIALGFLSLMGFKETKKIFTHYRQEVEILARDFSQLARKFYPKRDGLVALVGLCHLIHVFDFSAFFRIYPLLKRTGRFTTERGLSVMCDGELLQNALLPSALTGRPQEEVRYLEEHVFTHFTDHCVSSERQLKNLRVKTAKFIERYDALFNKIMRAFPENIYAVEARAYVINEDRFYLFPTFTPTYILSKMDGKTKYQQTLIDLFIRASKRTPATAKTQIADIRVYKEGYYCILLDGRGNHQHCFSFFKDQFPKISLTQKQWILRIDSQDFESSIHKSDSTIDFISKKIDNSALVGSLNRETSLMFKDILISYKDTLITPTDFLNL